MIAVVDYGVGNLYSLTCSLRHIGAQCTVTREENALRAADRIILPGVGAFGDAAEKLHALRLDALLRDLAGQGKPLMGICLGMQMMVIEYSRNVCKLENATSGEFDENAKHKVIDLMPEQKNIDKKTSRDNRRHKENEKLK